jgi:hypothetical protein
MPRDQRVIAGQGAQFDVDLGPPAAVAAQTVKLALVGGVGDAQMLGEGTRVAGDELA